MRGKDHLDSNRPLDHLSVFAMVQVFESCVTQIVLLSPHLISAMDDSKFCTLPEIGSSYSHYSHILTLFERNRFDGVSTTERAIKMSCSEYANSLSKRHRRLIESHRLKELSLSPASPGEISKEQF